MVGPLRKGKSTKKYLLVIVDKFTQWIEAKPVATARLKPRNLWLYLYLCDILLTCDLYFGYVDVNYELLYICDICTCGRYVDVMRYL